MLHSSNYRSISLCSAATSQRPPRSQIRLAFSISSFTVILSSCLWYRPSRKKIVSQHWRTSRTLPLTPSSSSIGAELYEVPYRDPRREIPQQMDKACTLVPSYQTDPQGYNGRRGIPGLFRGIRFLCSGSPRASLPVGTPKVRILV
jgi:hypothetical protein